MLLLLLLSSCIATQAEISPSPCPHLFAYDPTSKETDEWYGTITLSDSDLLNVWPKSSSSLPSVRISSGPEETSDEEYHIWKHEYEEPHQLRFFLKFDPKERVPKLLSFRLNGKPICSEPSSGRTSQKPVTVRPILNSTKNTGNKYGASQDTTTSLGNSSHGSSISLHGSSGSPAFALDSVSIYGDTSISSWNRSTTVTTARTTTNYIFSELENTGTASKLNPNKTTLYTSPDKAVYPQGIPSGYDTENRDRNTDNNLLDYNCGTVIPQAWPLTAYGRILFEGEFPWHAALYHAKGIDLAYICGASLISKNHVITASHCVTRRRSQAALTPDNLVVYLGKHYLKRFMSPEIQDRHVSKIVVHPHYDPQTYSNDIAILKLLTPADITDYVRPICLWQESTDLNALVDKQGSVVGWGFDQTGKVTERLMQAKMAVVSQETCFFSFPDFYSGFALGTAYCARFQNGTSICNGDSGSGMVFPKSNSKPNHPVWQLRGLVSISAALQNQFKCDPSHYVVFTDAAKYSEWIKKAMKE